MSKCMCCGQQLDTGAAMCSGCEAEIRLLILRDPAYRYAPRRRARALANLARCAETRPATREGR